MKLKRVSTVKKIVLNSAEVMKYLNIVFIFLLIVFDIVHGAIILISPPNCPGPTKWDKRTKQCVISDEDIFI